VGLNVVGKTMPYPCLELSPDSLTELPHLVSIIVICPRARREGVWGLAGVAPFILVICTGWCDGQLHTPVALSTWNEPPALPNRRLGGALS
jgi:hypothetical protein